MRKTLQGGARFAELQAKRFDFTNPEFLTHQVIQGYAARDDVAASAAETEIDLELGTKASIASASTRVSSRLGSGCA